MITILLIDIQGPRLPMNVLASKRCWLFFYIVLEDDLKKIIYC